MKDFFISFGYSIKHLFPMFHGVRIYRPLAWKLMWQCLRRGFDDSYAWDFYYNITEYIYPRLLDYFNKIDTAPGCPQKYYDKARDVFLKQGKTFDAGRGRFVDKEDEEAIIKQAIYLWKRSVWTMIEAFRDIIDEEENWDAWRHYWNAQVDVALGEYKKLHEEKEQKAYWDSFGFDREWHPGIIITKYDFSERLRKRGLKLFAEEFQNLWR